MRSVLLRAARVLAAVLTVLLLPAGFAAVAATAAFAAQYAPGPDRAAFAVDPVRYDPAKPTAAVVVGALGAEVTDVLAPYEILAATGRFNVYVVGPERRPIPLTGGLDLVPDLTFGELATVAGPDLVVVPALPDVGEPTTAPVTEWLRTQADRGTQLLGICNGAGVLASSGLLDGRTATSHWIRLRALESSHPEVDWVRGQRVVDDGDVVTTAGVLAGVDGTLHVVERMFGPAVARDAAAAVGWRHYGSGPPPPVTTGIPVPDAAAILNAGFTWDPLTVGVALTEGVGEIEAASVFDTQSGSLATRTLAVTATGEPVRSRHGLTFVPRADLPGAAPQLDRLLVPGLGAPHGLPASGGPAPEYVHDRPGFAFDATVTDLARSTDVATARWVVKALQLPTGEFVLDGPAWPWWATLTLVVLAIPGTAAVLGVAAVRRRRHAGRRPVGATRPLVGTP